MGIGEKLREAREASNLTLDELQEATKIQKRYLKAIEEGNFHILPGSFYARAFIKEYASAVGLNANELLSEHDDELPSLGEKRSPAQYTRIQRTRKSDGQSKASAFFSYLPTVIVILLIIVIIALAVYFYKQRDNPSAPVNEPQENDEFYRKQDDESGNDDNNDNNNNNNNDDENEEENQEVEEEEPELEPELSFVESNPEASPPESTFELINGGEEIHLVIEANGKAWLDVVNDSNESLHGEFITEENSPLEFDITEDQSIWLNIGNASLVDVKINDVLLEYDIDENDHVHQQVNINLQPSEDE